MINLTINSILLLDQVSGHAQLDLPEVRNSRMGYPLWGRYRTDQGAGAPCGGPGYRVGGLEPESGIKGDEYPEYPSMEGKSEIFGGPKLKVTPGATFTLPILTIAQHGGYHYAVGICTEGEDPRDFMGGYKDFQDGVPEGWTIFKLSEKQRDRELMENLDVEYLTCDTFIPGNLQGNKLKEKTSPRNKFKIYLTYDVPADFCKDKPNKEATIIWVWEANPVIQGGCQNTFYKNRCQQKQSTYEKDSKRDACAKVRTGNEIWYNCLDVMVGDNSGEGQSRGKRSPPEDDEEEVEATEKEEVEATEKEEVEAAVKAEDPPVAKAKAETEKPDEDVSTIDQITDCKENHAKTVKDCDDDDYVKKLCPETCLKLNNKSNLLKQKKEDDLARAPTEAKDGIDDCSKHEDLCKKKDPNMLKLCKKTCPQ